MFPKIHDGNGKPQGAGLEAEEKSSQTLSDSVYDQFAADFERLSKRKQEPASKPGSPFLFVDPLDDGQLRGELHQLQSFAPPKPLREASGEDRIAGMPSFLGGLSATEQPPIESEPKPIIRVAFNEPAAGREAKPNQLEVQPSNIEAKPDKAEPKTNNAAPKSDKPETESDGTVRQTLTDGSVLRTRPDGAKLQYPDIEAFRAGHPSKVINANSSSIEIEWNGDKIASIKHSSGDKHYQISDNVWSGNTTSTRGQSGRVEVDPVSGSLSRTYVDGPNKGTKEVFKTNGTVETYNSDGTMSTALTLPDGRKLELIFNQQLDASHLKLSQPSAIKISDAKGTTVLKHAQGDRYTAGDTTVGRQVSISADGSYEYKELDRKYSVRTDSSGRSEVVGENGSAILVNGKVSKYLLADGTAIAASYDATAPTDLSQRDQRAKGKGKSAQLDDGTYVRDDRGRVVSTESSDGKLKRTFKYTDTAHPTKSNEMTVGNTTYKYLGPITSNGQPVTKGGLEMGSWSTYDKNGSLTGNWYGYRGVSENGVYTEYNYDNNQTKSEGADGVKLSDVEIKRREESGIWFDLPGWKQEAAGGKSAQIPDRLSEDSENRQWSRNSSGEWKASPIDASKPYKEPIAQAEILANSKLDFAKRVELMHNASKFEAVASLSDFQKKEYASNVRKQLGDLEAGFKGTVAIDSATGAFVKTTSEGTRKDIRDVHRLDGIRESHRADGSMDIQFRFPDNTIREFAFKSNFSANPSMSQPESIRTIKPDGSEYLWKHTSGDEYDCEGTKKKFSVTVTADGAYSYKNLETGYRLERDNAGRLEEETPADKSLVVMEKGRVVSSKLGTHETAMQYDKDSKLSELRHLNENRVWSKDANGKWSDAAIDSTKPFAHASDFELAIFTHDALNSVQKVRLVDNVRSVEGSSSFSDSQKKEVRKHAESLLADRPGAPMTREERAGYVDQLYWHIANPKRNEQGGNNSCNVTTLRGVSLFDSPQHVARVVADVANTGELKTTDGSIIKPPIDSVRPRKGSPESTFPPADGSRSALGKLWDVASINVFYQRQTTDELGSSVTKGSLTYCEVAPTGRSDTGNRLAKKEADGTIKYLAKNKGNNRVDAYDGPRMYASRVGDVNYQITGQALGERFLIHTSHGVGDSASWKNVGGLQIDSKAKLEQALSKGKFPYMIQGSTAVLSQRYNQQQAVNEGKDPNTIARPTGGEHLWLVTGYDAKTRTVSVDNSWSSGYDVQNNAEAAASGKDLKKHISISVDDLYDTMQAHSSEGGESYTLTYAKFK